MQTPSERYRPGARRYDGQNPEFEYGEGFQTRRVYGQGTILWAAERTSTSPELAGEKIGLREEEKRPIYGLLRLDLKWLAGESDQHLCTRRPRRVLG